MVVVDLLRRLMGRRHLHRTVAELLVVAVGDEVEVLAVLLFLELSESMKDLTISVLLGELLLELALLLGELRLELGHHGVEIGVFLCPDDRCGEHRTSDDRYRYKHKMGSAKEGYAMAHRSGTAPSP